MDNLLDIARKFDDTNTVYLREQLRASIENSTPMEPMDKENADSLLVIGEQIRELLSDRYQEFEDKFTRLIDEQPTYKWAAETIVRQLGLVPADAIGSSEVLRGFDSEQRRLSECGCVYRYVASGADQLISECAYHLKESAS